MARERESAPSTVEEAAWDLWLRGEVTTLAQGLLRSQCAFRDLEAWRKYKEGVTSEEDWQIYVQERSCEVE